MRYFDEDYGGGGSYDGYDSYDDMYDDGYRGDRYDDGYYGGYDRPPRESLPKESDPDRRSSSDILPKHLMEQDRNAGGGSGGDGDGDDRDEDGCGCGFLVALALVLMLLKLILS